MQARVAGFDANLVTLTRQYKNKRRQQENALDEHEFNELQADIDQLSARIKSVRAERDEATGRLGIMRGRELSAKAIIETAILQGPTVVHQLFDYYGLSDADRQVFAAHLAEMEEDRAH